MTVLNWTDSSTDKQIKIHYSLEKDHAVTKDIENTVRLTRSGRR